MSFAADIANMFGSLRQSLSDSVSLKPPVIGSETADDPQRCGPAAESVAGTAVVGRGGQCGDLVFVDYETEQFDERSGRRPHNVNLVGIAYACGARGAPIYSTDGVANIVRSFGSASSVYHNAVFDRGVEWRSGLHLADRFDDTMIMASLLELCDSAQLKSIAEQKLGVDVVRYGDVDPADSEAFAAYARQDVELTRRLYMELGLPGAIREAGLEEAYQIELGVVDPTIAMMRNGISVDREILQSLIERRRSDRLSAQRQLNDIAGHPVNLASSRQLTSLLFGTLGLKPILRTRRGNPSTSP